MRHEILHRAFGMLFAMCVLASLSVNGQQSPSQSETQKATLFSRAKYPNPDYGKSAFNFQHGLRSDDEKWAQTTRNYAHLLYGSTSTNVDSDWFSVSMQDDDSSRIKDMGALQWSEVYFTPFLPANPHASTGIRLPVRGESFESSSDQRITKVIAGHIYVLHIKNNKTDLYIMFRVDELVPSDQCSISWKVMPSPEE